MKDDTFNEICLVFDESWDRALLFMVPLPTNNERAVIDRMKDSVRKEFVNSVGSAVDRASENSVVEVRKEVYQKALDDVRGSLDSLQKDHR